MKNKSTVTIGIPAYNEEANINNLLKALLSQKPGDYVLEKIIVVSDASTDKTVEIVKGLKNKKIKLMQNVKRIGQSETQNLIIKNTDTDILILINADVMPKSNNYIEKMISPFNYDNKLGLVGAKVSPLKSNHWFEKILVHISNIKTLLYEDLNQKNNIYLCHGRARAFERKLYKKLKFPKTPGEDAYSYLICKKLGFNFIYQPKAVTYYKNPNNLNDHLKQSTRFYLSQKSLIKYFPKEYLYKEYYIPRNKFMKFAFLGFIKDPIRTVLYLPMLVYSKTLTNLNLAGNNHLWDISASSKKLFNYGKS